MAVQKMCDCCKGTITDDMIADYQKAGYADAGLVDKCEVVIIVNTLTRIRGDICPPCSIKHPIEILSMLVANNSKTPT